MIKSVDTCLNCESLESALNCSKHNLSVQIDNVCDDHSIKKAFSKMIYQNIKYIRRQIDERLLFNYS